MKINRPYILPSGVRIKPNLKAADGLKFTLFYNTTYTQLYCLVLSNSNAQIGRVFGGSFGDSDGPHLDSYGLMHCSNVPSTLPLKPHLQAETQCIFIVFPKDFYENTTIGMLAHECLHAVDKTFEVKEQRAHGDEQHTYLLQWLVDQCLSFIDGAPRHINGQSK